MCTWLDLPSVLPVKNHKMDPVDWKQKAEEHQYLFLVKVSRYHLCALLFYRILAKQIAISLAFFFSPSRLFRNTTNPLFLFSSLWTLLSPGRSFLTAEAVCDWWWMCGRTEAFLYCLLKIFNNKIAASFTTTQSAAK